MSHIDTAEMYDDAELVVAEAIEGRRNDCFLVSKVLPSNASRRGTITACERFAVAAVHRQTRLLSSALGRGGFALEETVAAFD